MTCPHCQSTKIRVLEQFDDGDGIIDVEVECLGCGFVVFIATSQEELDAIEGETSDCSDDLL
jgi:predicted RNA-binding protein with TRAM domain